MCAPLQPNGSIKVQLIQHSHQSVWLDLEVRFRAHRPKCDGIDFYFSKTMSQSQRQKSPFFSFSTNTESTQSLYNGAKNGFSPHHPPVKTAQNSKVTQQSHCPKKKPRRERTSSFWSHQFSLILGFLSRLLKQVGTDFRELNGPASTCRLSEIKYYSVEFITKFRI